MAAILFSKTTVHSGLVGEIKTRKEKFQKRWDEKLFYDFLTFSLHPKNKMKFLLFGNYLSA